MAVKEKRKGSPASNGESPQKIRNRLKELSDSLRSSDKEFSIILAAGHGKRIKSERSKMLHQIWGRSTIERVSDSVRKGLASESQIIVVGIKAEEVSGELGGRKGTVFAHQGEQKGTGHAVQIALSSVKKLRLPETVYIFPGDMGLITKEAVRKFKNDFKKSRLDMMVMTGVYEGDVRANYYGRIIRVPDHDVKGRPSGKDEGRVIEILEHKDILRLPEKRPYVTRYNGRDYAFTRDEILGIREFNSGVYAFKTALLQKMIGKIGSHNAQGEMYLTDMIALLNQKGFKVGASPVSDPVVTLGFNNKSVLKQMESIYRQRVYDRLKDIIMIVDPENFYIADEVVEDLLKRDQRGETLDIEIGVGAYVGPHVRLGRGARLSTNARLKGGLLMGENVHIGSDCYLKTHPGQMTRLGDGVQILYGVNINGNVSVGKNCRIESSVRITGSDDWPAIIGDHVLIKGTSYIFGTIIESDVLIEHSVLIQMHVERVIKKDGSVQDVRFFLPLPEGLDSLRPLEGTREKPVIRRRPNGHGS